MTRRAARPASYLLSLALFVGVIVSASGFAAAKKEARLQGVYPFSGDTLKNEAVFFFDRPLAQPAEGIPLENMVVTSPPGLVEKVTVRDNALVVTYKKGIFSGSLVFVETRMAPELASKDGNPVSPEGFPVVFRVDGGRNSLGFMSMKAAADSGIHAEISLPMSKDTFLKYYTGTLLDPDGNVVPGVWDTSSPEQLSFSTTLPPATKYPVTASFARQGDPPPHIAPFMKSEYSVTLPARTLGVDLVRWKTLQGGRGVFEIQFTDPVLAADAAQCIKLSKGESLETEAFECLSLGNTEPSTQFLLAPPENTTEQPVAYRIQLKPPLLAANGALLFHDSVYPVECPPRTPPAPAPSSEPEGVRNVEVYWHEWMERGADGPVYTISLSAALNLDELRKDIQVQPEVEGLEVNARGNSRNLVLSGNWQTGVAYTIQIPHGVGDGAGNRVLYAPVQIVTKPLPKFTFAGFDFKGKCYIPNSQYGPLTLKTRNAAEATVSLHRVFPSNIARAVLQLDADPTGSWVNESFAEPLGNTKLSIAEKPDTLQETPLNLDSLLPADRRGVFTLSTQPSDWANTQMVLWTNLGVVGHWKDDEVLVFVHDLHTLAPVAGATVSVWSSKSQQMATLVTDRDGIAHFSALESRLGTPVVAVVEMPKDATFLKLEHREQDTPQVSAGLTPFDYDGYDAFLHCDRNLYRPGETVHARWIVRTRFTEAAANVPLLFQLQNPKGRVIQSTPVTLSELGTGGLDITTEKSHLTGKYTAALRVPGGDAPLGSVVFTLEEFVPNRMKANVAVGAKVITPDSPVDIRVTAENLFGGPAPGRTSEAFVVLRPGVFKPEQWPGYVFSNDSAMESILDKLGEKTTDENGLAVFPYTYKARQSVTMPLEAAILGSVYEMGGREVRGRAQALVFPGPVALGLALAAAPTADKSVEVAVAAVLPDGQPADLATATVSLEEENWVYNIRRFQNRNEPWYVRVFEKVHEADVPLAAGKGVTQFPVAERWGRYRVVVRSKETPLYASSTFLSRWNRLEFNAPASPSLIRLSVNKDVHTPGDTCELHIQAPYDGVAFVAVQNDRFRDAKVVPVVNGEALLSFVVTRDHFPNAWLEVTVVRKSDPNPVQAHPFSSFAMAELKVSDTANRIEVSVPNLPTEVRPAQHVEFTVETKDAKGAPVSSEVTLAAVDEGIHNILEFANPDPFTWFQRSRLPRFNYAHYYDKVAYDFTPASVGGDAILKRLGGAPQIGDNWIKPVALWSGAVRTDANGLATVGFDLPEFNGQLRLVAVAATPGATGSTAGSLFVRRPYILQTSMPRFALPGDTFACGASVINTTQESCQAVIRWRSEGTLSGAGEKTFALAPGATASDRFEFSATAMGQGRILWEADILPAAGGAPLEHLAQEAPIPVRAPAAWQSEVKQHVVNPGETLTFQNTAMTEDQTVEQRLHVSGNPLSRMTGSVRFLWQYPYDCVEQTTSKALPMLLFRHNTDLLAGALPNTQTDIAQDINNQIGRAVGRLLAMQAPSGGLVAWPGSSTVYPYGSVYAAHFLTLARLDNAAHIPDGPFRALQNYLRQVMNGAEGGGYEFHHLFTRAYALYVLALDGQLDAVEAIPRFDRLVMPESGRWLLAAALARNTSDPARLEEYLSKAPSKPYTQVWYSGDLNSEIREQAVKLMAAVQMGRTDDQIQPLVDALVQWLDNSLQYYTTQDAAFVVTAMNAHLSRITADHSSVSATITGPDGAAKHQGGGTWHGEAKGAGKAFTVANTGTAPLYVTHVCSGVPAQPRTTPVSEGMTLSRTLSAADGTAVEPDAPVAHGASYLVDLTITLPKSRENVILSDTLPAGLEIANPRLDKNALAKMGKEQKVQADDQSGENGDDSEEDAPPPKAKGVEPQYLEARDDRLVVSFESLKEGTHHFYYVVRAVTPGTFRQPALQGECMYNPEIRAVTLDKTVTIQ